MKAATNILVVYYSAYGHVFRMAQAVAGGAEAVDGCSVRMVRIAEIDSVRNRTEARQAAASKLSDERELIMAARLGARVAKVASALKKHAFI
ncbi:hypothetical protein [Paenibacillus alkalitolerans]|uniref:hypothetical protein n=1 Tax=Paenibacillus alkalitolerans TaxID=2799335 RepID=UPI0018F46FAD|nr:hypothetical protein [Paenibacillus alkalitolerans]